MSCNSLPRNPNKSSPREIDWTLNNVNGRRVLYNQCSLKRLFKLELGNFKGLFIENLAAFKGLSIETELPNRDLGGIRAPNARKCNSSGLLM